MRNSSTRCLVHTRESGSCSSSLQPGVAGLALRDSWEGQSSLRSEAVEWNLTAGHHTSAVSSEHSVQVCSFLPCERSTSDSCCSPMILLWDMRASCSAPCCPDASLSVNGKLELPQATSLLEGNNGYSKCATLFACI